MAETPSPDTPSNPQSSMDTPSIDAYVSSLIASGAVEEGQFYKWTTPSGEEYYGPNPRRPRIVAPRTQRTPVDPLPRVEQPDTTEVQQIVQRSLAEEDSAQYGDPDAGAGTDRYHFETAHNIALAMINDGITQDILDGAGIDLKGLINPEENPVMAKIVGLVSDVLNLGLKGIAGIAIGEVHSMAHTDQMNTLATMMDSPAGIELVADALASLDRGTGDTKQLEKFEADLQEVIEEIEGEIKADENTNTIDIGKSNKLSRLYDIKYQASAQRRDAPLGLGLGAASRVTKIYRPRVYKSGFGPGPGPEGGLSQLDLDAIGLGHLNAGMGRDQGGWKYNANTGRLENPEFPGGSVILTENQKENVAKEQRKAVTSLYPGGERYGGTLGHRADPGTDLGHWAAQQLQDQPTHTVDRDGNPIGEVIDSGFEGVTVSGEELSAPSIEIGGIEDYSLDPGAFGHDAASAEGAPSADAAVDSWYHEGGLINKNSELMGGEDSTDHDYQPLTDARPMFDEGGMVKKPSYQAGGKVKPQQSPYAAFQNRANQQTRQMMQPKQQPGQRPQPMTGQPRTPAAKGAPQAGSDVDITAKKGEFIIPVDVVKIKGTEFFEKAISGARKTHFEATGRRNVQKQKRISKNVSRFNPNAPKSRRNPFGLPKIAGTTPSPGTPPAKQPKAKRPVPGVRPTSPVSQQPGNMGGPLRQPVLS
jgi:hypothetical protein